MILMLLCTIVGGDLSLLFSPKVAKAAYTGKQIRTVEYVLGAGSDMTSRGDNILTYVGNTWATTKAGAGVKQLFLEGSGIVVRNAYIDFSFMASNTINVVNVGVTLDVEKSHASGTDARVAEDNSVAVFNSSAPTGYIRSTHDVTSLFSNQSDSEWTAGIDVVAGFQVDLSGAGGRTFANAKLILTYELSYSASAHNEVKTVRFPLDSTVVGDTGTRQSQCAAAATCSFDYHAYIPDATSDGDILDVYFEVQAEVDSSASSSFRTQINGGSTGPLFAWSEGFLDDVTVNVIFRPTVGGANFNRSATQTLDVINGTAPLNVLGGELVVTYRFDTGASLQTETMRYFLNQRTTAPGTTRNNFSTTTVTMSNSGGAVRNLWYRLHAAPVNALTINVFGKVVSGTERSQAYAYSGTNPRAADTPMLIFDLSQDAGIATSSTAITGATQYSATGGSPIATEAWLTFTWDGTSGGAETQTVQFSRGSQGVTATASYYNNTPVNVFLPETVTKTRRSSFVETVFSHSDTTSVVAGTVTSGVNANTIAITETADTTSESYSFIFLYEIGTSTLASTTYQNTIPWTSRTLELTQTVNQADERQFGNTVVITYDANYAQDGTTPELRTVRTVEYLLGSASDNTSRGDNVLAYAGTSWNAVKATAGTKNIILKGTNIEVVDAYLDVSFLTDTALNVQNIGVFIDIEGASSAGTDTRVGQQTAVSPHNTSGLTGYVRSTHNVTALFDRQTDAMWSDGLSAVVGVQVDYAAGGARRLTNVKLVLTYAQDFSTVAHNEVKTVRFPLDSTNGSDIGSRTAVCGAGATCSFSYRAEMPEDALDSNIQDVFFELNAEVDSGTANTLTPQISGGSGGTAFNWNETFIDDTTVNIFWAPSIGGANFTRSATQTLDIVNGTVPVNVLGGEVVVTYQFASDATSQTETVRYFLHQQTTGSTTARVDIATTTVTIANGGLRVRNLWYKMHTAPTVAQTITMFGKVGPGSTERSAAYTYAGTNPRAGDTPFIIFDLSDDAYLFSASSTALEGAFQFSAAGGGTPAIEAYLTFTWSGREQGPQTRTVVYGVGQQGTSAMANSWINAPVYVTLPETVTKTQRSVYLEGIFNHSETTNIQIGAFSLGVGAGANFGTTTVQETNDVGGNEAYTMNLFASIASTTVATSTTINWTRRVLEANMFHNMADEVYTSGYLIFTYDADFPSLTPRYTQYYYRFYANNDGLVPYDPWPVGSSTDLIENAELTASDTPPIGNEAVRIRMALTISSTTVASSSQAFKLQYSATSSSCGAVATSSWADVGGIGSGAAWRGTSTPVADGALLSTNPPTLGDLVLSVSDRAGTFEEENASVSNPWPYLETEDVEYDWVVSPNPGVVATSTRYCFRMVKDDATPLNVYTYYPTITTAGFVAKSRNWRWYDDETNETPTTAFSGENVAPVNVGYSNTIKLRLSLREVNGVSGVNQKFRIQFSLSSSFDSGISDVAATSTCVEGSSGWCYGNGVDTDGDSIVTPLLSASAANGTHNEAPTTTTTLDPVSGVLTEYEFTLRNAGANANTVYFFRAYDVTNARPVLIEDGASYPSLSTEGATLTVTIAGVGNASTTEGVTTTGTSTAVTIPFGTLALNATATLAQRITVSTDAPRGYTTYVRELQDLVNDFNDQIPDVVATNSQPAPWNTTCLPSATGCFGYHAGDDSLEDSTRFLANDTWALLESTAGEIMYNSGPTTGDVNDIIYQMYIRSTQQSGSYSTLLVYTVIPTF